MKGPRLPLPLFKQCSPYICNKCILSSRLAIARPFSSSTPKNLISPTSPTAIKNPLPPPTKGFAYLPSRRLISLSGPDSTHFLQGVITANLSPAKPRFEGFYTAFLNAQGRVLNDVFIYPNRRDVNGQAEEGWLIEVDTEEVERLAKHIKRFKLRAKFEVRVIAESEMGVWSLWDEEKALDEGPEGLKGRGCVDGRAVGMGRRLVLDDGGEPEVEMDEANEGMYTVRRYLKGIPEGQKELIRESALPQESNIDYMGGIDYRKGCYVGQELTIRTHHTGVVRKRILPIQLYGVDEKMPVALEYDPLKEFGVESVPKETSIGRIEKKGRSVGKWLAGVGNIGLALCRLETMTSIQLQGELGGYKEGDEFKVDWQYLDGENHSVKVKAFVPSWHAAEK